jgi:hypothetical protein
MTDKRKGKKRAVTSVIEATTKYNHGYSGHGMLLLFHSLNYGCHKFSILRCREKLESACYYKLSKLNLI